MALTVVLENAREVVADAESWEVDGEERLHLRDDAGEDIAEFYTWVGVVKGALGPRAFGG